MKVKILYIIAISFFITSINFDYPNNIKEIESVNLLRPDKSTKGKHAEIKYLTENQVLILIKEINQSKNIGPVKFIPDFFIEFKTIKDGVKRIKVNGNFIKGYENDNCYKISNLKFLKEF